MQIHSLQSVESEQVYYEHNFMVLLESHLTMLRTSNIRIVTVSKHQGYKYEGDLYGLLQDLAITKKFHYIVMRVNGYEASNDFKGGVEYLVLPDFREIDMLKAVYQTKNF